VERIVVDKSSQAKIGHDESSERNKEFTPGPTGSKVDEHGAYSREIQPAGVGHETGKKSKDQEKIGGH
jgi:hypothetical protein